MQWITYYLFECEPTPTPTPTIKCLMVPRVTAGARFERVKRNRAISPHPNVKVTKGFVAESRMVRNFRLYILRRTNGRLLAYSHPLNPPKSEKKITT